MIETVKQAFLKYWFVASSLAIAALYLLFDERGRTIQELHMEIQKQKLAKELQGIQDKSQRSQDDYNEAMADYNSLKQRHSALLSKLGLPSTTAQSKPTGPGSGS